MQVNVFHNVGHVRNAAESYIPSMDGHRAEAPLTLVASYDVPVDSITGPNGINATLEGAFHRFNVGSDEIAAAYRARRNRSLSVGDVVEINGSFFAVARCGFTEVRVHPEDITNRLRYGSTPVDFTGDIDAAVAADDRATEEADALVTA